MLSKLETILLNRRWQIVLFFNTLFRVTQNFSSGRTFLGRITSKHRKSHSATTFRKVYPIEISQVVQLDLSRYNSGLVAQVVTQHGLIYAMTVNKGTRLQSLVVSSLLPVPIKINSYLPLKWIPVGIKVTCLLFFARAAGTYIQILRHRVSTTQIKLPSKRILWVNSSFSALVGQQGNSQIKHQKYSRAGVLSWLGRRPRVRGVAMNPIDHPHGGGQGKTSGGRPAVTPWGRLTKGFKTAR